MATERQPIFYPIEVVPSEIRQKVAWYLDQPKPPNWRSVIAQMPPEMYTATKVEEFASRTLKPGGSPTLSLLEDLEKRQVSLLKFVQWLKQVSESGANTFRILSLLIPFMGDSFGCPHIFRQPEDQELAAGMTLVLSCEATGQAPLHYQWFKGKVTLNNETSNKLMISAVDEHHQGKYICRISNVIGCLFTRWVKVEVLPSAFPIDLNSPVIIMHPKECCLYAGENLTLYCDAVGNPSPQLQWYFNDTPIKGGTDRTLIVKNISNDNAGIYHCEASNNYGNIKSLKVNITILENQKVPPSPMYEGRGADTFRVGEVSAAGCNKPASKIALVMGNQQYWHSAQLGELVHPRNDVRDVAGVLSSIGFRVVTLVDLTLQEMEDAIEMFCNILERDMYVVFYFAGHGFEVDSESYLMPVDASSSYKRTESISVSRVLHSVTKQQTKLNVLLLDCCRTTPMECKVDPIPKLRDQLPVQQSNTVICFGCCSQARVLECPAESNGFFAAQLIKHLGKEKKIDDVLFDVARGIHTEEITDPATGQRQIVYRLSTLVEELSLCDDPLPNYSSPGLKLWQEAHAMPESPVTVFENEHVRVDLSLVPAFSNVLLIHSNITTYLVSQCYVHFLVPSKVGGARVELLRQLKSREALADETVRVSDLQRFDGELDVHVEVNFEVNGQREMGRAVYSLQEKPLYARITKRANKAREAAGIM